MLFLKTLWAHGFKSFAEPTKIDFNEEVTGIVGPNGSGKSNITDAIRWALGEQSQKSLRGKNIDDIVFAGSSNKKALDKAIVKLVFSNDRDTFSTIDTDVVEIIRTYDKKRRESEFFINGEKVRLKNIQEIAMETGLTKSSLAIISQGTITNFTSAKPEERRELFNEAAGVAKYKKRKQDALNQMIKTKDNLNRINDIVLELERRLPSLEKAAKKAELYMEKYNILTSIELSLLIKDGKIYTSEFERVNSEKEILDKNISKLAQEVNSSNEEFNSMMNNLVDQDKELSDLNNRFNIILSRLSDLKSLRDKAEAKENESSANQEIDQYKSKQLKNEYQQVKNNIENEKDKQYKYQQNITEIQQKYDILNDKYNDLYHESEQLNREENSYENKILSLKQSSNNSASGASQLIINNANRIGGVIGTLLSLISIEPEYQEAISSAAYNSMNFVVMKTSNDTKRAAEFLKTNQAGRATFLPLDQLTSNTFSGVRRAAIEEAPGFVGFANELVKIDKEYQKALDYVLGSMIVVKDYDSGKKLAKQMDQKINIVTLEGDRFLPKGAITAGKFKNQSNIFASKNTDNIEEITKKIEKINELQILKSKEMQITKNERDNLKTDIDDLNVKKLSSQNFEKQLLESLTRINDNYRILTGEEINGTSNNSDSEFLKLSKEIIKFENERDEIQSNINKINSNKNKNNDRQKELSELNQKKRDELDALKESSQNLFYERTQLKSKLDSIEEKLLDRYDLTLSNAIETQEVKEFENEQEVRELITQLTLDIKEIGNVDMDAVDKYKEEKEHYDYYSSEKNDIQTAFDDLQSIINDLDATMEVQFKRIIDDVNEALPDSFSKLFGGGSAQLRYTDPEDILNTGIEIDVFPPGKKITNINLLSGGEKSLVALSVLFSILKVRPLPLVVLDEAEAPLDPSNVERFAQYIKNFTNNTQFIVVTHREGTMENMDILFGVTMQQKGITKIVKIKLIDAKQLIE